MSILPICNLRQLSAFIRQWFGGLLLLHAVEGDSDDEDGLAKEGVPIARGPDDDSA